MKSALKIENLSYKNVLKNIDLDVEENNIYALIGKSGSGKTTLLKCISGLLKYSGTINTQYHTTNIGIYFNEIKFIYNDVYSNLYNILINLGISKSESKKKVFDICKKLNIDNLIYNNIDELSYSEKKVVMFAKTVIYNPDVILLDDIFEGMDNKFKNKIISYLKNLKKKTIILITSNPEDLLFASKIIILNGGKVAECGDTFEILTKENLFIKNDIKMPFVVELSHKLKSYELIDNIVFDEEELVNLIWK